MVRRVGGRDAAGSALLQGLVWKHIQVEARHREERRRRSEGLVRILAADSKDGLSLARKTHAGGWVSNWTLYYMIARRCFRLSGSLLAAALLAARRSTRRSTRCSLLLLLTPIKVPTTPAAIAG